MNQILVTKKLYVTPELRRKKKYYKFALFLSVFLVCLLSTYYIYAEYDRNKSEEVSQEILSGTFLEDTDENNENEEEKIDRTTIDRSNNVIVVALLDDDEDEEIQTMEIPTIPVVQEVEQHTTQQQTTHTSQTQTTSSIQAIGSYVTTISGGTKVYVDAIVYIPKLEIKYPVLSETTDELLKMSVNKFWGPNGPNEVGNYCIVGHNYSRNEKLFFGRLSELVNGDIVELTDGNGRTIKYKVYDKYVVEPEDVKCTSQLTNGRKDLTLITCTNHATQRLVVKAKEVK